MENGKRGIWVGVALGVVAALLGLLVIALVVASTGAYNVAASEGHAAGTRWLLDTTMHASVRSRAEGAALPAGPVAADIAAGAGEYKAMCQHCHGGPGVKPEDWSRGMLPQPPHMVEAASEWSAAELTWIVRNGIKYTGMPAFGGAHDEQALRDIVAFVEQLPAMTPETYRTLGGGHSHGGQRQAPGDTGTSQPGADASSQPHVDAPGAAHSPH